MTPWSVSPSAGWPKAAARAARSSILHAPSSSEYSEWTCRWAQAGLLTARAMLGGRPDGWAGPSPHVAGFGSPLGRDALDAVRPGQQPLDGRHVSRGARRVRGRRLQAGEQGQEGVAREDDGGVGAARRVAD